MRTGGSKAPSGAVVVGAVSMLLLSSCTGGEATEENVESSDTAAGVNGESDAPDSAEDGETLAQFCASDPKVTESDRARVMDVGPLPGESPEQVPMPYQQQLEQDSDFQPASEDGPAEGVPVPEFSALLCDEHADNDARSAALSQWFEFYYYGELTGDEELAAQLFPTECSECLESLDEIRSLDEGDMWIDSEPMTGLLHMWQMGEDPETRIGFVKTQLPGYTIYGPEGEVDSGGEGSYTRGFEFEYSQEVGHWQLVHVREASMGDDVFADSGSGQGSSEAADVDAPELPAEAEEKTAEGALAALDHWFETFDYVARTGDSGPMEAMHNPHNDRLSHFYDSFTQQYADGGYIELRGESHIQDVEVYVDEVTNDDAALVYGDVSEADWDTYDATGELVAEEEGQEALSVIHAMIYDEDLGHWQLAEYHPGELDEARGDLGLTGAEPDLTR
ncbi:hypothetical protein GCM10023354_01270 [Garicola koreensis]|uniref:DUF6318 family protein n=1 Tax=Garicola koreensis TaxID=1262554 RepID=UPI0031E8F708